jgi:hypothetical protein
MYVSMRMRTVVNRNKDRYMILRAAWQLTPTLNSDQEILCINLLKPSGNFT